MTAELKRQFLSNCLLKGPACREVKNTIYEVFVKKNRNWPYWSTIL